MAAQDNIGDEYQTINDAKGRAQYVVIPVKEFQRMRKKLEKADAALLRARLASAPADDEPLSDRERKEIRDAQRRMDKGEFVTHEEVARRNGLR